MNIIELSRKAYQSAKRRGLYDKEQPLEHYLMLIIDEISECHKASLERREAYLEHFKCCVEGFENPRDNLASAKWKHWFEQYIHQSIQDELADICIMCCSVLGWKMESMSKFEVEIIERNLGVARITLGSFKAIPNLFTTLSFRAAMGNLDYILAYAIQYCKANNINLEWHIEQKMKYNELRER